MIRSPITVYDPRLTTLYIDKTLEITMDHITTAPQYMSTPHPQNIHYSLTLHIFQFISPSFWYVEKNLTWKIF